ncbi:MAG: choice-of-anchor E domain-containing protein [Isosphaeraceae bacterium]|nr:choice-of-anchor E domain-containing protein [Isosphaeraceae bacterium]
MNLLNSLSKILNSMRSFGNRGREKGIGNKSNPSIERLESLCLLSTLQTIVEPTVSVGPTLTNFGTSPSAYEGPQAFSPTVPLFDPSLGTLVAINVSGSAQLVSQIGVENLSNSSPATITADTAAGYEVDGISSNPITGTITGNSQTFNATTFDGTIDYSGSSGHTFAPSTATSTISETLSSPSDLAFFTATTGHTSITPTLSATGQSSVTAPGGNLATSVMTKASGQLTISYEYIAPTPPSVVSVVRYGVHREQTQLIVTFSGNVDPVQASNASNYQLLRRGANGQYSPTTASTIPIKQVIYNAETNTATIIPAHSFSFRTSVQLTIKGAVFGSGGKDYSTVFGGKSSVGGFIYHNSGRFFSVQNGKLQLPQTTPPPGFVTTL